MKSKLQQLFDKIAGEETNIVYEQNRQNPSASPLRGSHFISERNSVASLKVANPSPLRDMKASMYGSKITSDYISYEKSPNSQSRDSPTFRILKTSKFAEIIELKNKNNELIDLNRQLRSEMKYVDEFDVAPA